MPPLKREVVELRPVYIVRNFYHSLFLLSDDMGVVFINTIHDTKLYAVDFVIGILI